MVRLLHLSDPHFHREHHAFALDSAASDNLPRNGYLPRRRMVDAISDALRGEKVDALLVTGDLTYRASDDEFALAVRELDNLRIRLGLSREQVLLVPGNHDVDWAQEGAARFDAYAAAYATLRDRPASPSMDDAITVSLLDGPSVRIIGVNSCAIESKEHAGIGAVGADRLKELLAADTPTPPDLTILCLHHHLLPVVYEDRQYATTHRSSVTLDASAVLDICNTNDVRLVLHGHQHQPSLSVYGGVNPLNVYQPASSKLVWVSGAGSCGAVRSDLGNAGVRHFQIIELARTTDGTSCHIRTYASDFSNEFAFRECPHTPLVLDVPMPIADVDTPHFRIEERVLGQLRGARGVQKQGIDKSDLFIFLLRALDCKGANAALQKIARKGNPNFRIEGVYDLYGEFDLLVKVRAKNPNHFEKTLDVLGGRGRQLIATNWGSYIDIASEWYPLQRIALQADKNTHSIKAFLRFTEVEAAMAVKACAQITDSRNRRTVAVSGGFTASGGTEAIVEYYVACGAYYELSEVVTEVETQLGNAKKVTLLAQTAWEHGC
jgi:3',5'-cyclic AMP phosphodiesterase CpdA